MAGRSTSLPNLELLLLVDNPYTSADFIPVYDNDHQRPVPLIPYAEARQCL